MSSRGISKTKPLFILIIYLEFKKKHHPASAGIGCGVIFRSGKNKTNYLMTLHRIIHHPVYPVFILEHSEVRTPKSFIQFHFYFPPF